MIPLLTDNDWTHIQNILGGIGMFIFMMFGLWVLNRNC